MFLRCFGLSVIIILLVTLVYLPGLPGDFAFDDLPNLLQNDKLKLEKLDYESLKSAAFSSDAGLFNRPLAMATFAINYYFSGFNPLPYKIVNILVHACNSLLLLLIGRFICRIKNLPLWPAVFVAAAFAIHPLNLTTVLYVVQRMASLSAFFIFLGVWLYMLARKNQGFRVWLGVLAVLCTVPALLAKENGALLPFFLLLTELVLFRFQNKARKINPTIIFFFVIFAALPFCYGLFHIIEHPGFISGGYVGRNFTLPERLLTETRVLCFYLKNMVVPNPYELGLYHDDIAISHGLFEPPSTFFAILFLLSLLALGVWLGIQGSVIGLGLLWFFLAHSMESTILPLEIAHEHRNYLGLFGILLGIAGASSQLLPPLRRPWLLPLLLSLWVLFLGLVTASRAFSWRDNVTQALSEAAHHPNSPASVYAAGRIYANLALTGQKQFIPLAFEYLERARKLSRQSILPHTALIVFAARTEQTIDPLWIDGFEEILKNHPVDAAGVSALKFLATCKQCNLAEKDWQKIWGAVFASPNLDQMPRRKATLLTIYGEQMLGQGKVAQGARAFEEAAKLVPGEPQYAVNLVRFYMTIGNTQEAGKELTRLKSIDRHGIFQQDISALEKLLHEEQGA